MRFSVFRELKQQSTICCLQIKLLVRSDKLKKEKEKLELLEPSLANINTLVACLSRIAATGSFSKETFPASWCHQLARISSWRNSRTSSQPNMVKVSCMIISNFQIVKHFFVPLLFMLLLVSLATWYAINNKYKSVKPLWRWTSPGKFFLREKKTIWAQS